MSNLHGVILKSSDFLVEQNKVYINPNKTNGNPGMLLIHGDFCGHCHKFYPTFNSISDKISRDFSCVSIESKELKNQDLLMSALDFKGFPTICFFNQDGLVISQYNENRDEASILNSICKTYHQCYN